MPEKRLTLAHVRAYLATLPETAIVGSASSMCHCLGAEAIIHTYGTKNIWVEPFNTCWYESQNGPRLGTIDSDVTQVLTDFDALYTYGRPTYIFKWQLRDNPVFASILGDAV